MKLLLSDSRIDPTRIADLCIAAASDRQDDVSVLLTLLRDPRIGRNLKALIDLGLSGDLRAEQYDKILSLINTGDVELIVSSNTLCIVAEQNNTVLAKQLLQEYKADPNTRGKWPLCIAIIHDYPEVVEVLLQDERADIDEGILYLASRAETKIALLIFRDPRSRKLSQVTTRILQNIIQEGQAYNYMVELLLGDPNLQPGDDNNLVLRLAIEHWHGDIILRLISDPRVDPSVDNDLLLETILKKPRLGTTNELLEVLTQDERVDKSGDRVASHLSTHSNSYTIDVLFILMRSRHLDFNKIPSSVRSRLISRVAATEEERQVLPT